MYRFTLDITVEGKPYKAGDTAAEKDIPAGCLDSLKRLGRVEPVEQPKPAAAPAPAAKK